MIELFEGVPGAGKSFYAIGERFLPWVKADRRIYVYVDGVYIDRLAYLLGRDPAELEQQLTIWTTMEHVKAGLTKVEPNSAVLIDEAQDLFRSQHRVDPVLLRWLETHRHYGVHVVMMCQDYRNLAQTVTRLVECTTRFTKLWFVGFSNRFQAKVRGNPEETETIRSFTGRYDPKTYAFYDSYASNTITEQRVANHVWFQPKVLLGLVAGLFVALILWLHPWTSLQAAPMPPLTVAQAKPSPKQPGPAVGSAIPLLSFSASPPEAESTGASAPAAPLVHIQGVLVVQEGSDEERVPRYLLGDGSALTAAQITGRYGITVQEYRDGSLSRLVGAGVVYDASSH